MPQRSLSLALLLLIGAAPAGAQILQVPRNRNPGIWVSGDIGYLALPGIADGSTGSIWDFGSAISYRMSIERPLSSAATLGAVVTRSDAPLVYRSLDLSGPCPGGCNAKASVWTIIGNVHVGGGPGFHQLLDLGAGVTQYGDFRRTSTSAKLPPASDMDLSIVVGYGFGYSISDRVELTFVQDAGLSFHQRGGLSNNANTANQQYVTRLGLRYGFSTRSLR